MASYVENTLIKDEKIIYEGKISLWSLLPMILLGLILLPFAFLGLLFWVAALIRYLTTELAFTNKRVIAKFGFISRKTIELNLSKVESPVCQPKPEPIDFEITYKSGRSGEHNAETHYHC